MALNSGPLDRSQVSNHHQCGKTNHKPTMTSMTGDGFCHFILILGLVYDWISHHMTKVLRMELGTEERLALSNRRAREGREGIPGGDFSGGKRRYGVTHTLQ